MSTATSVTSISPRGASFEGASGRPAAAGGDPAAGGDKAVGFAGLLFSHLEGAPGQGRAPARGGEALPAGGESLPATRAQGEPLKEAGAQTPAGEKVAAVAEEPAEEEIVLAEQAAEVEADEAEAAAMALEGELAAPEVPASPEGAEGEGQTGREKGDSAQADELVAAALDEEMKPTAPEQAQADPQEADEDVDAREAGPESQGFAEGRGGEGLRDADVAPVASAGKEASTTGRVASEQARSAVDSSDPAAVPGQARAATVAAETSAVSNGVPGQERSLSDVAAGGRTEPVAGARGQASEGGQGRGEGVTLAAEGQDADTAEGDAEARSQREFASGRGASEFPSQKDGAGKAEFVLPSAKELTFENPFRSLGLGTAEAGGRHQGGGSLPAPSLAQLQQTYQGSATGTTSLAVAERFGTPQWGGGVSQRIMWMANQQVGRAELRLDPPELGSLTVRLNISQDQASVSFVSPHAHVRDALEQQMPRLREMLAENGLNLQDADVSDQSASREGGGDGREEDARGAGRAGLGEGEGEGLMEAPRRASLALVDFYA